MSRPPLSRPLHIVLSGPGQTVTAITSVTSVARGTHVVRLVTASHRARPGTATVLTLPRVIPLPGRAVQHDQDPELDPDPDPTAA